MLFIIWAISQYFLLATFHYFRLFIKYYFVSSSQGSPYSLVLGVSTVGPNPYYGFVWALYLNEHPSRYIFKCFYYCMFVHGFLFEIKIFITIFNSSIAYIALFFSFLVYIWSFFLCVTGLSTYKLCDGACSFLFFNFFNSILFCLYYCITLHIAVIKDCRRAL